MKAASLTLWGEKFPPAKVKSWHVLNIELIASRVSGGPYLKMMEMKHNLRSSSIPFDALVLLAYCYAP